MKDIPIFLIKGLGGGIFVLIFAAIGEVIKPRGFAGIFAGAPSVAVGSLLVTLVATGEIAARGQAAGMIAGGLALVIWCLVGTQAIKRFGALKGSIMTTFVWLVTALGLWVAALQ